MTAFELPEDVPDGTFGGARTTPGVPSRIRISRPDPNAEQHVAEMLAAVADWHPTRTTPEHP